MKKRTYIIIGIIWLLAMAALATYRYLIPSSDAENRVTIQNKPLFTGNIDTIQDKISYSQSNFHLDEPNAYIDITYFKNIATTFNNLVVTTDKGLFPTLKYTIPTQPIANALQGIKANFTYKINFSKDITPEINSKWITMSGNEFVFKTDFTLTHESQGINTTYNGNVNYQKPFSIDGNNVTDTMNVSVTYTFPETLHVGDTIYLSDPILPDTFCDGGNTLTYCWINRTHLVNATDNILSAKNVIINNSGQIRNQTAINFYINLTGNFTMMNGASLNFSGSSGTSTSDIKKGSNIHIVSADTINISNGSTIISRGGSFTAPVLASAEAGGIINLTAKSIYIDGTIDAVGGSGLITGSNNGGGGTGGRRKLPGIYLNRPLQFHMDTPIRNRDRHRQYRSIYRDGKFSHSPAKIL